MASVVVDLGEGLGLAEARRKAEDAREQIADGVDPAAAKTAARDRRKAAAEGHGTLGSVIAAYYEVGPGKDLRSGKAARALIEVVFADHLSRPVARREARAVADRRQLLALEINGGARCGVFPAAGSLGAKRELVVKGFDDLEMPALAQDGKEIGQHVLSREEVGKAAARPWLARS